MGEGVPLGRSREIIRGMMSFPLAVWEHSRFDKVLVRASGLAYTSLIATVPLTAVLISIFSISPAFDSIEIRLRSFLVSHFLATRQAEIEAWIEHFAAGASRVGIFGFLLLILTSIVLLFSIESNFNEIWRVARHRPLISRITSYTSVLVLGSLFAGASLTLSARLQAILLSNQSLSPGLMSWLSVWVYPFLFSAAAFLLAYLIIPNATVAINSALTGALSAAFLFEAGKHVFARATGAWVNLSLIYGSLAVLPIFLVWLYYTWIVVLFGLEIAYTHQYHGTLSRPSTEEHGLSLIESSLRIYLELGAYFEKGNDPPTTDTLSRVLAIPSDRIAFALRRMESADLIFRVAKGQAKKARWIPAHPPEHTSLPFVIGKLIEIDSSPGQANFSRMESLQRFCETGLSALGETTVQQAISSRSSSQSQG